MSKIVRTRNVGSGDLLVYYVEGEEGVVSRLTVPIGQIKRAINAPIIRPRFRLQWLTSDEVPFDVIPSQDIISGGSYSENYESGQRRTVSLTLFNGSGKYTPSINGLWLGAKFKFEMGLNLDSGETVWFPKGVYYLTNISANHGVEEKTVEIELGDKYSFLESKAASLEGTYTIPVDSVIENVIKEILSIDKGNGEMIDPIPIVYHESFKGKTVQASITEEAGSTYGSIINELATMLSAEVFYDVEGHLNFVPITEASDDYNKPLLYDLYEQQGDFGSNNLSFDMDEVINRVIVIGDNVNNEICDATAVNDDPSSPLCYQRIGYRTSIVNDSNITSSILAQERADYELRELLILKTTASNTIRFNPLLSVNNLISVTDNFFDFHQERFLIQSISCSIDYSGAMSISTTNTRNLPFAVEAK